MLGQSLRRMQFWKQNDGVAAVEFAFVLPVMLAFFFGLVEVAQALTCRSNVISLASTGADLIAQENTVTPSDMSSVFNALNAMLYPFSATSAKITITSVVDNNSATTGRVAWSCTKGGTARATNSVVTVPTGLITAGGGGSVVMTEVTYTYASPVSTYFVGNVTMTNTFYAKPRRVAQITLTGCA